METCRRELDIIRLGKVPTTTVPERKGRVMHTKSVTGGSSARRWCGASTHDFSRRSYL